MYKYYYYFFVISSPMFIYAALKNAYFSYTQFVDPLKSYFELSLASKHTLAHIASVLLS